MKVPKIDFKEMYADVIAQREEYSKKKDTTAKEDEFFYCFDAFMECSAKIYHAIAKKCRKKNIGYVYDIGCCYPFQSRIFKEYGIEYTGIEVCKYIEWDGVKILHGKYPFKVNVENWLFSAAISNLCVGYLITDPEAYDQIREDFSCLILGSVPKEERKKLNEVFSGW